MNVKGVGRIVECITLGGNVHGIQRQGKWTVTEYNTTS